MRSLKTREYADYYLLLEECIKYFNDYQIELNKKYIIKLKTKLIKKDNKINHLEEKLNNIIEHNKETKKMNKELIEQNNKTHKMNDEIKIMNEELLKSNKIMQESLNKAHYKLDETLEKLDDVHEELENTHNELEETNEKLDTTDKTLNIVAKQLNIAVEDRVIKTRNKLKNESFIIMYNPNESYKYKVIRGKKEYVNPRIDKLKINGYIIIDPVETLDNVPNASNLWCLIKEKLKNNIDYCGNNLNLINIDPETFMIKVNEIYNKRKNVII
jgi:DNA repair exonuclease SbcCD ATPase subunit